MTTFLAIDFETAGYDRDSACAVGLVVASEGRIIGSERFLIRPPSRDFRFTHIHGLTWNDVREAPDFGRLWPRIEPYLRQADFLAAHNASFDRSVLGACCARYGLRAPRRPFECTMMLARSWWSIYPTKLPDVCRHLGISLNHHDALSDAEACARIVIAAERDGWRRRG